MNSPTVSIIVPCYNQAQYLNECLQSVLDQVFTDWECIIVNDGSSDNTLEIAQYWLKRDIRFKYLNQKNGGLSSARNKGIETAKGDFILPLDADDRIGVNYIFLAIKAFKEEVSLKVVYCLGEKFGIENSKLILKPFSLYNLSKRNMIFCSALYRKEDWTAVGGYDVKMVYGLEDWEFWIAILKNGGEVKCLNYLGFFYRIKPNSMLRKLDREKEKIMYRYLSVKHADFFVKQLGSFIELHDDLQETKNTYRRNLNSKKFIIDIFCNKFFSFTIFKKI